MVDKKTVELSYKGIDHRFIDVSRPDSAPFKVKDGDIIKVSERCAKILIDASDEQHIFKIFEEEKKKPKSKDVNESG